MVGMNDLRTPPSEAKQLYHALKIRKDIGEQGVLILEELLERIRINQPEVLHDTVQESDDSLMNSLNGIIEQYSMSKANKIAVLSEFQKSSGIASAKGIKYSSVFTSIGKNLEKGVAPSLSQVFQAKEFYLANRQKFK